MHTIGTQVLVLRLVEASDAPLLFGWRNDAWIVSLSTSRRTLGWEEHEAWFASILDRSRHLLFIVLNDGEIPVGSLRLDWVGTDAAVISIYLMKMYTGKGLGPRAIEAGCRRAFEHWPDLLRILAHVRSDNRPSIRAFVRAKFRPIPGEASCPEGHLALVLGRDDP